MTPTDPDDDLDAVELTRLADGTLDPDRARELRARIEKSPDLAERLAEQERAVNLMRTAAEGVSAPVPLRRRVEELRGGRPRSRRAPRLKVAGVLGAAAITAAVVFALVVLPGDTVAPSIVEVAEASEERQPDPAPAADADTPALLDDDVGGVPFPRFVERFGWVAVASGTDDVEGRSVTTVVYELDGEEISYSIVDGDPLTVPESAETTDVDGVEISVLEDGTVTWERDGHTCVLASADGVPSDTLTELATWTGMGSVPF